MEIERKNTDNEENFENTNIETTSDNSALKVGTIGFLVVVAIIVSVLAYMSSPLNQKEQRNDQPNPQVKALELQIRTA